MSEILRVENLSYTYSQGMPNQMTAIHDINFSMQEEEFIGIIGATGSGKSTLISHFNGLLKPTNGQIYVAGQDMWKDPKDIRKFRFMVGLVFQYPEYQLFEETVEKDIAFGPRNMGLSEEEIAERVAQAATFCGIDDTLLKRSPFDLSGGQKRRAAIAGVIAMRPQLLVLDEPAAGLDPEGRDTILNEIKEYNKKTGTSVILVSHSMEDIAKYASRVLVLSKGHIAMDDATEMIFERSDELLKLGLSVPQVTRIFMQLKAMGIDIDTDVYTIKYAVNTILSKLSQEEKNAK